MSIPSNFPHRPIEGGNTGNDSKPNEPSTPQRLTAAALHALNLSNQVSSNQQKKLGSEKESTPDTEIVKKDGGSASAMSQPETENNEIDVESEEEEIDSESEEIESNASSEEAENNESGQLAFDSLNKASAQFLRMMGFSAIGVGIAMTGTAFQGFRDSLDEGVYQILKMGKISSLAITAVSAFGLVLLAENIRTKVSEGYRNPNAINPEEIYKNVSIDQGAFSVERPPPIQYSMTVEMQRYAGLALIIGGMGALGLAEKMHPLK